MNQPVLFEDSDFWSDYEQRKGRQLVPVAFGCEIHRLDDRRYRFTCIQCGAHHRYGAWAEHIAVVQAFNHAVDCHDYKGWESNA